MRRRGYIFVCMGIWVFTLLMPIISTAATVNLPRTGQTTCYDSSGNVVGCAGIWQDGGVLAGVEWPEPRFTDNGDGTITDNLTGLIWLKDGNCFDNKMTWGNALDKIDDFNINPGNYDCIDYSGNHADWRLPNINELESLVNSGEANTATWLNDQAFLNVQPYNYWSSTTAVRMHNGHGTFAYEVDMDTGSLTSLNKAWAYYVWPVRAGQKDNPDLAYPANIWKTGQTESYHTGDDGDFQMGVSWPDPRFTDNGDGTVTDNLTGLMWLKDIACLGHPNWFYANEEIGYFINNPERYDCQDYIGGYADWRIPNRKELFSVLDLSQYQPALVTGHPFVNMNFRNSKLSSTIVAYEKNPTWISALHFGYISPPSSVRDTWPVRAGDVKSLCENENGPYSVGPLSPDINPAKSEVMEGGRVYRYYEVRDKDGQAAPDVYVTVKCGNNRFVFKTNEDGLLTIDIDADLLGEAGKKKTCSIISVCSLVPSSPLSFSIDIIPRESDLNFKIGSGANIGGSIGVGARAGDKRGFVYKIINTDVDSESDDEVGIDRSQEMEVGAFVGTGIGGGLKGAAYAEAGVEAGISILFSHTNNYLFSDPYGSDEEKILRAGLIIVSLFQGAVVLSGPSTAPFINMLIDTVIDGYNPLYIKYKEGQALSGGVKVYGSASAGAGLGIGDKENVFLGAGIEAGAEIEAQFLVELLSSFEYSSGDLDLTEAGAGISFSASFDIGAGVGAGAVGATVGAGIGAGIAGEYKMVLYSDPSGNITKGEIILSGTKDWGIGLDGTLMTDSGSTSTITLIVTGDQLSTLATTISDIINITDYMTGDVSKDILLGPTILKDKIENLFSELNNMTISYKIEEESGKAFSFAPSIEVEFGFTAEGGFEIDVEKTISYLIEQGIISASHRDSFKLASYEEDKYIPSIDSISFSDIINDAGEGLYTAAIDAEKIISTIATQVGSGIVKGIKWGGGKLGLSNDRSTHRRYPGVLKTPGAMESVEADKFGLSGVFLFSPEDTTITELSSGISSPARITIENAEILITPGESSALITITYNDSDVSEIDENDLILFRWDAANNRWIPAEQSQVDATNNRLTALISKLGTFTTGIALPQGYIVLNVNPKDMDINDPSNISVISGPIKLSNGNLVPDGTMVTVASLKRYTTEVKNFGTITSADEDPGTDGLQITTQGGNISFAITPPGEEGAGVIFTSSIEGTAQGKAYFNTVEDLDTDDNGLPDYWEMGYFGDTGQNPSSDPDNDGLTNLEEYQNGTDPTKDDTDSDGMADGWEVDNGMNPLIDDANRNPDDDSYTNIQEYYGNSDPNDPTSKPEVYISISPTSYDFGIVGAGSISETQTFNFFNAGILDIAIGTISITGTDASQFIIQTNDCSGETIAPSGNCTFDLIFSPTSSGTKSANIQIPTSDPGTPTLNVYLTGTAPVNTPPMADAGPDQTVNEGDTVTLDGSSSSDPDDGIASYQWTRTAGPSINLSDPTSSKPSFTSPSGGISGVTLVFELIVTDKGGLSSTDTITITITASVISDGDVAPFGNRDGMVNVGDALVALRFALLLETPTQEDIAHGDVAPLDAGGQPNPDGVINVGDALVILRKALQIISF